MNPADESAIPEGIAFIDYLAMREQRCRIATIDARQNLGKKAPACLIAMGTVLSLLDRVASCWWGCRRGDHLLEYLVGRCTSSAMAGLHAASSGYYDEALNQARSLGEIANLFALFVAQQSSFNEWTRSSKRDRLTKFGPSRVRDRLTALNASIPIDQKRYTTLCERVTHPTPQTMPQSYNALHMPSTGQIFQQTGYIVALNEIALPLAFAAFFAPQLLLALPDDVRTRLHEESRKLAESFGNANLVDGYPVLTQEACKEVAILIRQAAPEVQPILQKLILEFSQSGGNMVPMQNPSNRDDDA